MRCSKFYYPIDVAPQRVIERQPHESRRYVIGDPHWPMRPGELLASRRAMQGNIMEWRHHIGSPHGRNE